VIDPHTTYYVLYKCNSANGCLIFDVENLFSVKLL